MDEYVRKPEWLKIKVQNTEELAEVERILRKLSLNTVCDEANCPNKMECFSKKTATFMILGRVCTRNCTFCNVSKEKPTVVDEEEPAHVAEAVKELGLRHVVITSVTRDDIPDGGSGHFAEVIKRVRDVNKDVIIEVLIPDFKGDEAALLKVVDAKPHIINHNIETVPRLYPEVRPMAVYERSLKLLENVKAMDRSIYTKSGIMLGLGEKKEEVIKVFEDLRSVDCDFLTIGQYLSPSKRHHPVVEYIHPDEFERYKEISLNMGFKYVASGPLVRSSYQAEKAFEMII
ncbi:MAG TPA: lipoyl synthase [Clostridiaceae bacterium]|nr:lipoyl synthase [Clostridiaceae bacterium]